MPDYWLTTACNAIPEKHLGQNSEISKATATISPLWELSTYICIVHMYISSPFLVHKFPTVHSRRLVCKANPDQLPGFPHPVASSPYISNKSKTQQFISSFFGKNPQFQSNASAQCEICFLIVFQNPCSSTGCIEACRLFSTQCAICASF